LPRISKTHHTPFVENIVDGVSRPPDNHDPMTDAYRLEDILAESDDDVDVV
jgi:hypothetical protein